MPDSSIVNHLQPSANPFSSLSSAPTDPIFATNAAFHQDPHRWATNLSIGIYPSASGKSTYDFQSVRKALAILSKQSINRCYLPITGLSLLRRQAGELAHGTVKMNEGRVGGLQTVGGSCGIRVGLEYFKTVLGCNEVWIGTPSWVNHKHIIDEVGMSVKEYRYYDDSKKGEVDMEGMLNDLKAGVGRRSVVLLQVCGYNPCGVDLDREGWERVADVVKKSGAMVLFDMAYLGFGGGGLEGDCFGVREFGRQGISCFVAQSFSKNVGVYNSRVGVLSICIEGVGSGKKVSEVVKKVIGGLGWIARGIYSSPPVEGGKIVEWVLGIGRESWERELGELAKRLGKMRGRLSEELGPGWEWVKRTHGMFLLLGLDRSQVDMLRKVHHVYVTNDSRLNVAALTEDNVGRVADGILSGINTNRF